MKMDKAKMMECYEKWLNKQEGFTRKTMSRKQYSKMMKAFSEAGLKRTNFACSIKNHESEKSYREARAQWMRQWRERAFRRPTSEPHDQQAHQSLDDRLSQQTNVQVAV